MKERELRFRGFYRIIEENPGLLKRRFSGYRLLTSVHPPFSQKRTKPVISDKSGQIGHGALVLLSILAIFTINKI
jgi:hypothetical protein